MKAHVRDIDVYYELEGPAGAPVVALSHSLAAALEMWESQMPVLRDSYRVLRFDTRGHGRSSAPSGPYTMEMLGMDAVGLLDSLGIPKVHFVGISMGGMIGQILALRHPERLEKLVLCDTTGRVPADAAPVWQERIRKAEREGMPALAEETLERWLSEKFRRDHPGVTESVRNMITNTPVAGYRGCSLAISQFDVLDDLPRVSAPTLILAGEKDQGTPVSAAEDIRDRIPGSGLAVIPAALHLTNIETAEEFNRLLLEFLGR